MGPWSLWVGAWGEPSDRRCLDPSGKRHTHGLTGIAQKSNPRVSKYPNSRVSGPKIHTYSEWFLDETLLFWVLRPLGNGLRRKLKPETEGMSILAQERLTFPQGPSAQIAGFQGPKTVPSMDFGT